MHNILEIFEKQQKIESHEKFQNLFLKLAQFYN